VAQSAGEEGFLMCSYSWNGSSGSFNRMEFSITQQYTVENTHKDFESTRPVLVNETRNVRSDEKLEILNDDAISYVYTITAPATTANLFCGQAGSLMLMDNAFVAHISIDSCELPQSVSQTLAMMQGCVIAAIDQAQGND
jgi:hypothetical protein